MVSEHEVDANANPASDGDAWKQRLKEEYKSLIAYTQMNKIRSPELELPEIDGKTQKMYRGGKICLTVHFKPLWAKNCPTFGIAHALCSGLAPSMACCRDSNSCGLRHD
ncbi:hypothetical protein DY000_02047148 [Brassica cretica]|uniref:Ubiquitin-fold modifier-conjugating enzyme 1 n=1 Tax=Brassica cretica TaxID=69181 RepID=A0ABQ7EXS1_BRACR|nr:hypothetical protein DY000_02047148 [Brassica cretica]